MKCKNCNTEAYLEMVDFMESENSFREKHKCNMCEQHGWRTVYDAQPDMPNTYEGCLVGDNA